MLVNFHFIAVW